ncbi:MAG: HAMP domain-containing sensor histidine kinase [Pseudomonadota bacterium]
MRRNLRVGILFFLFLATLFGAMGWLTVRLVDASHEASELRRRAAHEEDVRLALWRMDSLLVPVIGRESARPHYVYQAFYPAETAYTHLLARLDIGDILIPSPLLGALPEEVLLHFQIDPSGAYSSPQVPTGNLRDLAEALYVDDATRARFAGRLDDVQGILDRDVLVAVLPEGEPEDVRRAAAPPPEEQLALASSFQRQEVRSVRKRQGLLSEIERQARTTSVNLANDAFNVDPEANPIQVKRQAVEGLGAAPATRSLSRGVMQPLWVNGALFLARKVSLEGAVYIQGVWLDWPRVRERLLASIEDLLPEAAVAPASTDHPGGPYTLATIPVRLDPGPPPALSGDDPSSPLRLSLVLAWIGALLAGLAAGLLVRGILALSDRRAAFVSAVTHELRTPLTTFRMYTEMLQEGMVPDEESRGRYLGVLRAEAERLGHLVENVLSYARLERGRRPGALEVVDAGTLLERRLRSLEVRAAQAEMVLEVTREAGACETRVRADGDATERILYNLVDNACKYAAGAEDRRIHVECVRREGAVAIRVRDHGPGVAADVLPRLFEPFSKSAQDAAGDVPGVGLGLSLARRLARGMGGELRRVDVGEGACFELWLRSVGGPPDPTP